MRTVDTNLLVRLFVVDDADQAARARKLFDEHADEDGELWLADVVLVELVWALDRVYGRARAQIAGALASLSGNATVRLESAPAVTEAAALCAEGPCDFADCLLVTKARLAGCEAVRTFDKGMRALPGVMLL
jgi:predicted nucleic-acid-binding protein